MMVFVIGKTTALLPTPGQNKKPLFPRGLKNENILHLSEISEEEEEWEKCSGRWWEAWQNPSEYLLLRRKAEEVVT